MVDLIGVRFERLEVIAHAGINRWRQHLWLCRCDCGKEKVVVGKSLTDGKTRSCGCLPKEIARAKAKILSGVYGYLQVLELVEAEVNKPYKYRCVCLYNNCGNVVVVTGKNLSSGGTKSCGCLQKDKASKRNFKDLSNLIFGYLLVNKFSGVNKHGSSMWECVCTRPNCENIVYVSTGSLTSGNTKSCGCLSQSLVSIETKKYFIENYDALEEYEECINPITEEYLPYDIFFIYDGIGYYVEINGIQHYKYVKFFHKEFGFEYRQYKDKVKKKHAKENGIFIEVDIRKYDTPEKSIKYIKSKIKQ